MSAINPSSNNYSPLNLSQLGSESFNEIRIDINDSQENGAREMPQSMPPMLTSETAALGSKKKILVLSNSGGGGHKSASEALKRALSKDYDVTIDYTYDQIGGSQYFNMAMKKEAFRLLGLLTSAQTIAENFVVPAVIKPILAKKIQELKPDLVVSVFPVANYHTWDLAKTAGVPMLVLVTDLYCKHFFNKMNHPGENFYIGLPFNDAWIKDQLRDQFDENNLMTTGFPLRPDFGLAAEELQPSMREIREELGIREGDKIVLVMMGAQGGEAIKEISQHIADNPEQYQQDVHVVALCSANKEIREKTDEACQNPLNPRVKVHALGIKDGKYIATLMGMANVMVSKPGGASVNEAIASELYTIYDGKANGALFWERGNMEFSQSHSWGEQLDPEQLVLQVNEALKKPRIKVEDCPGKQFDKNINSVVGHIFNKTNPAAKTNGKIDRMVAYNQLTNTCVEAAKKAFFNLPKPNGTMDRVLINLIKREVREALSNVENDHLIENVMLELIENESVLINSAAEMILNNDAFMKDIIWKTAESLFPTKGSYLRAMENVVVKIAMYYKGKFCVAQYATHILAALSEILEEKMNPVQPILTQPAPAQISSSTRSPANRSRRVPIGIM
jgi:UDP-N-acetylglucosamine:LPS N-acetylglucosamine transferase